MQQFIRDKKTVFVSTADRGGNCDCSPRFRKHGLMVVIDPKTLAYPEFRGNGAFASLANLTENPHIGLLLLDFLHTTVGLHVNETANRRPSSEPPTGWNGDDEIATSKLIEQWVYITVKEAYVHRSKYVPLSREIDTKDIDWGTDDPKRKSSNYFLK